MKLFGDNGAIFSECRKYRFALWRIWDEQKPFVMFIGLNPSTANETTDDPTIRRVQQIAKNWGFGGVYMMNLFTYVTPYPSELKEARTPTLGAVTWLADIGDRCNRVVFAWGNFDVLGRDEIVKKMFPNAFALHINKNGSPKHPLYCKSDIVPLKFNSQLP